jgi:hypothetical protein
MRRSARTSRVAAVLVGILIVSGFAVAASKPHYLITNDDVPPPFATNVTIYTVAADGQLKLKTKVPTGGIGIGGGYFAANRVNVLNSGNAECIYTSQATSGDIVGVVVRTLTLVAVREARRTMKASPTA